MKKEEFEKFLGKKINYTDIYKCKVKVREIKNLFCKGYEAERELEDIEIYLGVLENIILNEKRAFDDALKRLGKGFNDF